MKLQAVLVIIMLKGIIPGMGQIPPGDRHPLTSVDLVYPADCYLQNGGRVIDVTQLPTYVSDHRAHEDGTHPVETTDAILDTYDWVVNKLKAAGSSSWNHYKAAYIIYFPEGEYAINLPLIYRGDPWLRDNSNHENLYGIRIYGQSRDKTILRLIDNAPAFQDKDHPVAVIAFTKHTQNNSISLNGMQNLTINTGSGNPGAIGADFQGANLSFVRNLKVISGDGDGYAGLRYPIWPTQGYHCDITVEGFDYGIEVVGGMVANGPVFEYMSLRGQHKAGFRAQETITPIRKLLVEAPGGPAVELTTNKGHLVILDSRFEKGPAGYPAIQLPENCQSFHARNIELDGGFDGICIRSGAMDLHFGNLEGGFTAGPVSTLFEGQKDAGLNLPVEESPVVPYDPPEMWVSVESMGATPGDASDDSDAIQSALDACDGITRTTVYFRSGGEFRVSKSLNVPAGVRRIVFMWGGRINTETLSDDQAVFRIGESAAEPLILEDYFQHINGNQGYFIEHAATRPLICRNLRGSRDFSNYNHTSGNLSNMLFLENVGHMISEGCHFNNRCWARWINTETAQKYEFHNSGGVFWVMGFKCEDEAVNFRTVNGGYTEVLGGIVNQYRGATGHYESGRVFELIDSNGSFIASTSGPTDQEYDTIIMEVRNGIIKTALRDEFPVREDNKIHIPLFAGYENPLVIPREVISDRVALEQNFPNPFYHDTSIQFSLPRTSQIRLEVFSPEGRLIGTVASGTYLQGSHSIILSGSKLPKGILYYRLLVDRKSVCRAMIRAD